MLLDPPKPLPLVAAPAGQQQGGEEEGEGEGEEGEEGEEEGDGGMSAKRPRQEQQQQAAGTGSGGKPRSATGPAMPDTPASAAGMPLLVQSTPLGPAAAAAMEGVARLPAALAACCRNQGAAAVGVTPALVGRFMAAYSCRMRWVLQPVLAGVGAGCCSKCWQVCRPRFVSCVSGWLSVLCVPVCCCPALHNSVEQHSSNNSVSTAS